MINFKTGSIFSRKTGNELQNIDPEPANQILAVWGSPSSGKTIVSVKLAWHLASRRKNVALLLCDMTAPPLPYVCPPSDIECLKSLGSILAAARMTDNLIKHNCMLHKKQSHITIIGMLKGENAFTYPSYTAEQAVDMIEHLRNIVPYIIIDCGSTIATDILSAVALMESDAVLRLVNCDLKSISYLSSQFPLLMDKKWDTEKQYKVASNVKQYEALGNMEQILNGVTFKIPHSEEVEQQSLAGDLFKDLGLKDSRGFRKEIDKISMEVFGI